MVRAKALQALEDTDLTSMMPRPVRAFAGAGRRPCVKQERVANEVCEFKPNCDLRL
ncbi:hypothetical protein AM571_PC01115 (plasmid) [Rhizobium etli 8C-3]|uniref:Uncharacterized protein n=1 Tax=Rhizobium etli 8C-3 TaxID=538025 RepID=A0A1L5PF08_RHIET|nr:hypothetical protein AM571_PC01115 [Rhizobium etli 8C-3]